MTVLAFIFLSPDDFFVAAADDAISAETNVRAAAREVHPAYATKQVETLFLGSYNAGRM